MAEDRLGQMRFDEGRQHGRSDLLTDENKCEHSKLRQKRSLLRRVGPLIGPTELPLHRSWSRPSPTICLECLVEGDRGGDLPLFWTMLAVSPPTLGVRQMSA